MPHPISVRRSSIRPARLVHAITATGIGGAQAMLAEPGHHREEPPGCRETVCAGENGVLVPVGNAPALATAMMRFCREPALAERMGR